MLLAIRAGLEPTLSAWAAPALRAVRALAPRIRLRLDFIRAMAHLLCEVVAAGALRQFEGEGLVPSVRGDNWTLG